MRITAERSGQKKRVLLFNPPTIMQERFVPYGLAYISSYLNANRIKTRVVCDVTRPSWRDFFNLKKVFAVIVYTLRELKVTQAQINRLLEQYHPTVVGVAAPSFAYGEGVRIAKMIKKHSPTLKIIAGGVHPTVYTEEVLKEDCFDIVVIGEGEETFLELASTLPDTGSLSSIKGIMYKDAEGAFVKTPERPLISDLDSLPYPDLRYVSYEGKKGVSLTNKIFASRGCPYQCTYCATPLKGKQMRFRSAENVVAEMEYLTRKFNVPFILLLDDAFGILKSQARDICHLLIKKKTHIHWMCQSMPGILTPELLRLMKQAGCIKVSLGIQSASERILKQVRRPTPLSMIRQSVRDIKEAKLEVDSDFMIGFPDETEEDIEALKRLIVELDPDSMRVAIFTPLPGSVLYDELKQQGRLNDQESRDMLYSNPATFKRTTLSNEQLRQYYKELNELHFSLKKRRSRKMKYLLNEFISSVSRPRTLIKKIRDFLVLQFRI